ncbi:hypothetical protein F0562_034414 [Nyssa sinensis]|uniref:Uncharacterized protein n=1 Tax=Nyssa sinensis TaxID=561372 RepID=A0A5J5AJM3_9ASTE|nr:hypothetical protein F0562_034414 [Nyssa sinensis]
MLRITACRVFDTESSDASYATGDGGGDGTEHDPKGGRRYNQYQRSRSCQQCCARPRSPDRGGEGAAMGLGLDMADETIANGVALEVVDRTVVEITGKEDCDELFVDFDDIDRKVSNLNQKIVDHINF